MSCSQAGVRTAAYLLGDTDNTSVACLLSSPFLPSFGLISSLHFFPSTAFKVLYSVSISLVVILRITVCMWSEKVKVAQLCPAVCDPIYYKSTEFSRPEYWSGQPFPSPGDLPNPGIEPTTWILKCRVNHYFYPLPRHYRNLRPLYHHLPFSQPYMTLLPCVQSIFKYSYCKIKLRRQKATWIKYVV